MLTKSELEEGKLYWYRLPKWGFWKKTGVYRYTDELILCCGSRASFPLTQIDDDAEFEEIDLDSLTLQEKYDLTRGYRGEGNAQKRLGEVVKELAQLVDIEISDAQREAAWQAFRKVICWVPEYSKDGVPFLSENNLYRDEMLGKDDARHLRGLLYALMKAIGFTEDEVHFAEYGV